MAVMLIIATGCKPTEKNYREAYETAQNARRAVMQADADLGIPHLNAVDGPRRQAIGADSAFVRREALTLVGQGPAEGLMPYNVAVGKYKMRANALGDTEALRSNGYDAFVLADGKGEFYAVAVSCQSLNEAVGALRKFMSDHPGRPYVGLPSEPVIEIPLRR